jgi:hypothetical protein
MAEEKKSVPKQSKKTVAPKKEAKKPAAEKPVKNKTSCKHIRHHHLGNGDIIEELVVNNKPSYRIKFENLKNTAVFKKEEIIKE